MPDQIVVLVAEDEELVRLVIAEALRDVGLEVMEVEHAEAALGVLEYHAAQRGAWIRLWWQGQS